MQFKGEYPFNFHWGVKDTFMSEKAQIYSEADRTASIEIKLDTYLVTLWVMNDVTNEHTFVSISRAVAGEILQRTKWVE